MKKISKIIFTIIIFLGWMQFSYGIDSAKAIEGLSNESKSLPEKANCKSYCDSHPHINNCDAMCAVCGPFCSGNCLRKMNCMEGCMKECEKTK